jgi:NitT/TauT family transport system permease protein
MIANFFNKHAPFFFGVISLLGICFLWQASVDLGLINPFFVSRPSDVAREIINQVESGLLLKNFMATMISFFIAIFLATIVGVGLGLLAGWFRDVEAALGPFIWFKYSAPTIAFYPIFIALLGYGTPTIVAIAFLFAITPIYANTLSGIRSADSDLVRAAIAFGAKPLDIFLKVALPSSIPILLAGVRLGVGRALTGVVVAELFGATAGLGYSISVSSQRLKTTEMMASIIVIIILGVIITQILSFVEKRTDTWRRRPDDT